MDERKHVKYVGYIYIVLGILYFLLGAAIMGGLIGIGELMGSETGEDILEFSGTAVGVVAFIVALLNIIGGAGLLSYKNWARILVIILSVLNLFNFPIGTAIGVYALWILFKSDTKALFHSSAAV